MKNLPKFSQIDIKNFSNELISLLNQHRDNIKSLTEQSDINWQSLMQPLDDMDDELHQCWSPVSHMHSVVNDDDIRQTYQTCVSELSLYSTEIGQNENLFNAIKKVTAVNDTEKKIIDDELLGFKLSGVDLEGEKKERFKAIQQRLTEISTQFENNLLDATNAWKKVITDESLLQGMPEHAINTARELSGQEEGWTLTLDFPCFHAVVTYADNEDLRKEMHLAYTTRASDEGPYANQFDNSDIIKELLALRHEKAKLLGFNNYAELSLATKMAPSTDKVLEFLTELADKSLNQAKHDFAALEKFANKKLNPWDVAYYSEKQRVAEYDISQEELRPYFPEDKVIEGMFAITQKLYGITLKENKEFDTWHKDVRFYELYNDDNSLRGGLYVDLYARAKKRGGAWMDDCISYRKLKGGEHQLPVAFLTCNFAPPSGGRPACFSHDEVLTLFHEFGHCLHHLMSKIDYLQASGINGVEWDAVELPSQFFENWCWQEEAVSLISEHVESKAALPKTLFDKLNKAKNFQAAMMMMRQIEFALFDFSIHLNYNPENPEPVLDTLGNIREQYAVVPYHPSARFPHGFSHIFAGGYAAGYYSYKWAEVLSSDAFSRFEEEGIFNRDCGQAFLDEILSKGSSRKAIDSFIAFRKREPNIDALLRHNGIG